MKRSWTGFGQSQLARGYRIRKKAAAKEGLRTALRAFKKSAFRKKSLVKCHYCGKKLTRTVATADHYQARSQGGSNKRKNLRVACYKCNQAKGSMSPREFMNTRINRV